MRRASPFLVAIVWATASLAAWSEVQAQSTTPPPPPQEWWQQIDFGATLEGYYQYNFNETADRVNLLRAYDTRANTFSLQQAALVVDAAPDVAAGRRFGLRVDFQFGQATERVHGSPANEPRPDAYRNVWQAFGSYVFPVGRGLQVDFGKFASNLGYETNYAKDNQAFSRASCSTSCRFITRAYARVCPCPTRSRSCTC